MELLNGAVIGGVVGALITGGVTGGVMIWRDHKEEERLENAVLQAIKTEIKIIMSLFYEYKIPIKTLASLKIKELFFEKETTPEKYQNDTQKLLKCFDIILINMPDPVIYYNNCSSIGKIKDGKVRESIVTFYCLLDSFRESIRGFTRDQKTVREMSSDYNNLISKENLSQNNPITPQNLHLYNLPGISKVLSAGIKKIKNDYVKLDKYFDRRINLFL